MGINELKTKENGFLLAMAQVVLNCRDLLCNYYFFIPQYYEIQDNYHLIIIIIIKFNEEPDTMHM